MRSWARRWMFKAKDMMTLPQRQITMPMKVAQPDDSGGESGVSDCLVQSILGVDDRGREEVYSGEVIWKRLRRIQGGGRACGEKESFLGIGELFVVDYVVKCFAENHAPNN